MFCWTASRYNSCKWPTWRTILFSYMFIPNLYMFRALNFAHHQENYLYQYDIWYMSLYIGDRLVSRFLGTLSVTIGMNLWFAPQISEHCPCRRPGRLIKNLIWLSCPGVASAFTPNLGYNHPVSHISIGSELSSVQTVIQFFLTPLHSISSSIP